MTSPNSENKKKKPSTGETIVKFSGLGLQIALIIGGGAYLGSWIDEQHPMEKKWFTLIGVLVSVSAAIVYAIKTLNRFNK